MFFVLSAAVKLNMPIPSLNFAEVAALSVEETTSRKKSRRNL